MIDEAYDLINRHYEVKKKKYHILADSKAKDDSLWDVSAIKSSKIWFWDMKDFKSCSNLDPCNRVLIFSINSVSF